LLEELRGEGRYREKPKEEVEALGLRLNDILHEHISVQNVW
jgi:hypothetical protein